MTKATAAAEWLHVEQLQPWDRNPVIHDEAGVAELEALIASSVWTAPIVARRSDRRVIAGHGRRLAALRAIAADPTWQLSDAPKPGLVPVRFVEVDDATAIRLTLADNQLTKASPWDDDELVEILRGLGNDAHGIGWDDADLKVLLADDDDDDGVYTRKITAPVYEPHGPKPKTAELFDRTKSASLAAQIKGAQLPDDVAEFLLAAAARHTVFRYDRIAEFYAHADAPTQRLMEASALVIIDFGAAIENGFVQLTKRLGALADEETDG